MMLRDQSFGKAILINQLDKFVEVDVDEHEQLTSHTRRISSSYKTTLT